MTVWAPLALGEPGARSQARGGTRRALHAWRQLLAVVPLAAADLLVLTVGALAATAMPGGPALATWTIASLTALPLLFAIQSLDRRQRLGSWRSRAGRMRPLLRAAVVVCITVGAATRLAGHGIPLIATAGFGAAVAAALALVGAASHGVLTQALVPERALLVGEDRALQQLARGLSARQDVEVVGHVGSPRDAAGLGGRSIDHVVVAGAAATPDALLELSRLIAVRPAPISILAAIDGRLLEARGKAPSAPARAIKRAIDILGAGAALALLAPLMLLIAFVIRVDSPGPALFAQRRVGRHGRVFLLLKFRTMVAGAEEMRQTLLAHSRDPHWLHIDEDPRVTQVGRFLRRSSLDELPQLWNVLRGEMSLVGPRPLVEVEQERAPAWARARTDVNPGITGLWQVRGRTTISFEDMLRLDTVYVITWSLARDMSILVRTVPAVLTARGAN